MLPRLEATSDRLCLISFLQDQIQLELKSFLVSHNILISLNKVSFTLFEQDDKTPAFARDAELKPSSPTSRSAH